MAREKRYLSGIQPSGELHLGNYFGAMRQHVAHQDLGNSFYFIANYHALTTLSDPVKLRAMTFDVAASYLSVGLDPARAVLFRQSDVPEVTELAWLLSNVCAMGLLQRAVSYKDKVEQGLDAKVGLFTYPVLMAADILAYDSTHVPVGQDQVQHLEITRDLVTAFHAVYGEVFVRPEPMLGSAPLVPGLDGFKMSKSRGNTIPLMSTGKALKERINRIVTDSTPLEDPKDPEPRVAFKLYSLFATPEERAAMADKYRAGGYGDGHAKQELRAKIEEVFADARTRRARFDAHPDEVEDVLREGARKAREVARATLDRARHATGLA
ncbi:MAG: tryptophan--tRNA ligase [Polyangiales bacterium]